MTTAPTHPLPSAPLVSVIVPAYNSAGYLEEAVRSVLDQTHRNLEVVVVNDGSTDGTGAVAEALRAHDPRVKVVHQQNMGLPSARNSGIREAQGEYLAFLDADDVIRPGKVASQLAYLEAHPDCDLVYSDFSRADEELRPLSDTAISIRRMSLREAYAYTNVFPVMSPLLRRALVERVGDFDPALRACEDWDFWIRCERAGKFGYLPGYFSVYRMHGSQMHKDYHFMLKYCRMVAQKNYPRGSRHYRTMLGSFLWWQFGLHKQQRELTRLQTLFSPQVLGIALHMFWEVRNPREAWFIRNTSRRGL